MDRIDLQVGVNRLKPEEMTRQTAGEPTQAVQERVVAARDRARHRFQDESQLRCNAEMASRHLRAFCELDEASRDLLEGAIRQLGLSTRAMDRILKVARTIADLSEAERIESAHVAEAIQYRALDRWQ